MRRRLKPTSILSNEEVDIAVELLRSALGEPFGTFAKSHGISVEDTLRFLPVGRKCQAAREGRGSSIKQVAAELKVPQYRLKAVEDGGFRQLDPVVLKKYISHLGLTRWFRRWKNANVELAGKLGFDVGKRSAI